MLLKQVSDLGVRLGLDIRLWKPGAQTEDASNSFKMPVSVEVAGAITRLPCFLIGSIDFLGLLPYRVLRWDRRRLNKDELSRKQHLTWWHTLRLKKSQFPEDLLRRMLPKWLKLVNKS